MKTDWAQLLTHTHLGLHAWKPSSTIVEKIFSHKQKQKKRKDNNKLEMRSVATAAAERATNKRMQKKIYPYNNP